MAKLYESVIITGASSGIGEEFAKQLAPNVTKVILVARREAQLELLKTSLLEHCPELDVVVEVVDLTNEQDVAQFVEKIDSGEYQPDLLINNAGMGDLGTLAKSEWAKLNGMLQLNMVVLTRLAHAVIPGMTARGGGSILNVSSMAGILPIPDFAAYAASKAYVTSLSEALRLELREANIKVTALCPGPIHTEFGDVATRDPKLNDMPMKETAFVSKDLAVKEALRAMDKNKAQVYPGLKIKFVSSIVRLLPLKVIRGVMGRRPRQID